MAERPLDLVQSPEFAVDRLGPLLHLFFGRGRFVLGALADVVEVQPVRIRLLEPPDRTRAIEGADNRKLIKTKHSRIISLSYPRGHAVRLPGIDAVTNGTTTRKAKLLCLCLAVHHRIWQLLIMDQRRSTHAARHLGIDTFANQTTARK